MMSSTVLITGAYGRLGQAALSEFASRGWVIHTLVRTAGKRVSATAAPNSQIHEFVGDVCDFDAFKTAATGCDVILHAANPSYEHWSNVLPESTQNLINVAAAVDATIVMPGNVYPYGESMPPVLRPTTPHVPSCEHGQLRADLEASLCRAAQQQDVQTLLVRAGNYIDGRDTGNWFESYLCRDLSKGKFMYPGATDVECAWVYLPDVAKVMAQVAELRSELNHYEDIGIPGFSVNGLELFNAVEKVVGKPLTRTTLPWFMVKILGYVLPKMKAVYELRYLFFVPHSVDGARLKEVLPLFESTSIEETLSLVFEKPTRAG